MRGLILGLCLLMVGPLTFANQAPQFSLTDLDGNRVNSEEFIGKQPTWIIFWATW